MPGEDMHKRTFQLAAKGVLLSACVVLLLWTAHRVLQVLAHKERLSPRHFDLVNTTSHAIRQHRIILFLTLPYEHGPPLWLTDAVEMGNPFINKRCPYSDCVVSSNRSYAAEAALLVFQGPIGERVCCNKTATGVSCVTYDSQTVDLPAHSPTNAFVFYQKEAPSLTPRECLVPLDDVVNYTWTYKSDSDVQATYGSYYRFSDEQEPPVVPDMHARADRNVLWYVSNCNFGPEVERRRKYVDELQKHIDVDIYGLCSNISDPCPNRDAECVTELRRRYKFYIAFESSDCDEYVTEKFYSALIVGNVPIVRGMPRTQYERLAPPRSFIHTDDFASPQLLAYHLLSLASSPEDYNDYHAWRAQYGALPDISEDCKLCELATMRPPKRVRVTDWWSAERNCRLGNDDDVSR